MDGTMWFLGAVGARVARLCKEDHHIWTNTVWYVYSVYEFSECTPGEI